MCIVYRSTKLLTIYDYFNKANLRYFLYIPK